MYAVVGCSDCEALWVVEGRPETTTCPRCGTRHEYAKRKRFVTTDDAGEAKQARAALLARRRGHEEGFEALDDFDALEAAIEDVGTSDEEYLAGSGIDPERVAEAGERAEASARSPSRREVVLEALANRDEPDQEAIVSYATERGVPAEYVRTALEKLLRAGEITETDGRYRRL
ncbi:MAG: DUF5817 domain-containing protein [Halanaeroarchaeum sp.]